MNKRQDKLLDYANTKKLPHNTLLIASRLNASYLIEYIDVEKPSMQQFKKFVETVTDFQITAEHYKREEFLALTERRSAVHIKVDMFLKALNAKGISVNSANNFETNDLRWSFSTSSLRDLEKICEALEEAKATLDELYDDLR